MTDGPDPEAIQKIAEVELAAMTDSKARLLNEHAASFRWLIASLFASNGGGLIALANSDRLSKAGMLWAGGLFTAGVVSSLLTAWSNQRSAQKMMEPVSALTALWALVANGMPFDADKHNELLGDVRKRVKASRSTQIFGWASAVLFVVGVVAVGATIEMPNSTSAPPSVAPSR